VHRVILAFASAALVGVTGCGADNTDTPGTPASGGTAGTPAVSGGSAGSPASGGSAGSLASGGSAGSPASGGSAGVTVSGGSAGTPPTGGAPAVTYTKDVQPILMAKCGICHGGQNLGNHNIATVYEDSLRPAESLQFDECWDDVTTMTGPKTVGECSSLLVNAGKMPAFSACDKPAPPDPTICASQSEKDVIAAWVAGGMPR
jgi:hypothetical protein